MTLHDFIHETQWQDLPANVVNDARRYLYDTIGVGLAGRQTDLSRIIHDFVALTYGGSGAQLWADGRQVSPAGAAMANGMTIDAFDMHDGYLPVKGHAGAALVPAALATLSLGDSAVSGQELLTTLVIGYEIALRAGVALHTTVCDYHTSGAWNALGCAAIAARRLGLNESQTRHALGIAEYHGPRSQMMRCIDYPTMLKDGSGWGAMVGVSAAQMAALGFTGAPAVTVEGDDVVALWSDIGANWLITDQYTKPYAVCYWAQGAIVGALALQQAHNVAPDNIDEIKVYSFHEATRLTCEAPQTTEEAQYSLPFPVAAALVHHQVGAAELYGAGLTDPTVLDLARRVTLIEVPDYNKVFPIDYVSRVVIDTRDGQVLDSGEVRPPWTTLNPPTDDDLHQKFRRLAGLTLPDERVTVLGDVLWGSDRLDNALDIMVDLAPSGSEVSE
jgi:2-methylcitrate dehydratase PrpD